MSSKHILYICISVLGLLYLAPDRAATAYADPDNLHAAQNNPPNAVLDWAETVTGKSISIDVLENDTDPDGDRLFLSGYDSVSVLGGGIQRDDNGTTNDRSDDWLFYSPPIGVAGEDTFRYSITDGEDYDGAIVTVRLTRINHPPVASNDEYIINQELILTVPAAGVLENDLDPDGDALTAVVQSGPSNGELDLNADGSFTYAPDPGFLGVDTFTYLAQDYEEPSAVATVEIRVQRPDTTVPFVSWISPVTTSQRYNVKAQEVVRLEVEAEDNEKIDHIQFYRWDAISGQYRDITIINQPPYRIDFDTSSLNPKWNQVFARAYDAFGNVSNRQYVWIYRPSAIFLPLTAR